MNANRDELFRVLSELSALCPDVRIGQLVVNLSYRARGMAHESIWDMEDEELLNAARKQLALLMARQLREFENVTIAELERTSAGPVETIE